MNKCPIPLTSDQIPDGRKNRPSEIIIPKYITIHDTGNPNPGADARAHATYLKGDDAAGIPVSWHYTVDDKGAYQHLPVNEHGWHAGDGRGPGNMESIGIEICENLDGDRQKAEENAAALVAWLLTSLGLDVSAVVPHKHWSPGTECPHILLTKWEQWIDRVRVFKEAHERAEWDPEAEIALLKRDGLIDTDHAPQDHVTWGEFATVINRLRHVKIQ